jgi:hypothetical protein
MPNLEMDMAVKNLLKAKEIKCLLDEVSNDPYLETSVHTELCNYLNNLLGDLRDEASDLVKEHIKREQER